MTEPEGPPSVRPVIGGRHEAHERAVHLLYEMAMKGRTADEVLGGQVVAADRYTAEVVRGVDEHVTELDGIISRLARGGWTLDRMPTMDVLVLRTACFELAYRPEIPTGAVISEAVDLAGRYGTDDSSRFVNGLLATAAAELRPGGASTEVE